MCPFLPVLVEKGLGLTIPTIITMSHCWSVLGVLVLIVARSYKSNSYRELSR